MPELSRACHLVCSKPADLLAAPLPITTAPLPVSIPFSLGSLADFALMPNTRGYLHPERRCLINSWASSSVGVAARSWPMLLLVLPRTRWKGTAERRDDSRAHTHWVSSSPRWHSTPKPSWLRVLSTWGCDKSSFQFSFRP